LAGRFELTFFLCYKLNSEIYGKKGPKIMKKALVCGAGGFIGSHLVRRLKQEGYWARGVDLKYPEFSPTAADEFLVLDLREEKNCQTAVRDPEERPFDEVYQLAADMGGMGFIHAAECEIMRNSALINIHMIHSSAAAGIKRYFFSSSACVYRDMERWPGESPGRFKPQDRRSEGRRHDRSLG